MLEDQSGTLPTAERSWSVDDAAALYNVDRWGGDYFEVSPNGKMIVTPLGSRGGRIAILDVVEAAMRDEGLKAPLIIRFQDILHHRVRVLNEAFSKAIAGSKYRGQYRGVFPVKVNQLREVCEEIVEAGRPWHYGIEVGSKPEIFAGLALHTDNESLIICNGYKDDGYIRAALLGTKLGKKVILIAEKLSEVKAIVRIAGEMNVVPEIGMRIKLASRGAGKWAESSGEKAKFGLSTGEILEAAKILTDAGMTRSFKLLHFHVGSQIPDILIIKRAVREAARYYSKLRRAGHPIEYLDVGGGLAVDYDGSRSTFHGSMNYSLEEYARDIVGNIADICDEERVPHPHIVSESGRAIVAQHSLLVIEAFGAIERSTAAERLPTPSLTEHKLIKSLGDIVAHIDERGLVESWHDLQETKEEAQKMFELGLLELDVKANVEAEFWRVAKRIHEASKTIDPAEFPDDLRGLASELWTQHICNFSVFQSLLDHWSFGALFPVVPIHRLDERPEVEGILVDITCDSDGKISKFIDKKEEYVDALPLHRIGDAPYYLGVFLTGAYQDIMGDIHNLFGRVNEVHVFLDDDEECGYYLEETINASTIGDVLQMTQYDARDLAGKMKGQVDAAIKQDRLKPTEGMRLLAEYERGLREHTYLSF
ncbi:MAG: biosynthetic arginine decarboxylase [Labilithrix sp.]|nr:biosynthetic arginine decarboxylase [Labilithrix sp.]MCW5810239.1 biosynthetic arginine decarboxylase [Labilithrix sp.]